MINILLGHINQINKLTMKRLVIISSVILMSCVCKSQNDNDWISWTIDFDEIYIIKGDTLNVYFVYKLENRDSVVKNETAIKLMDKKNVYIGHEKDLYKNDVRVEYKVKKNNSKWFKKNNSRFFNSDAQGRIIYLKKYYINGNIYIFHRYGIVAYSKMKQP